MIRVRTSNNALVINAPIKGSQFLFLSNENTEVNHQFVVLIPVQWAWRHC